MSRPDPTDDRQSENPYRAPGPGRLLRCEQGDSVDAHFPTIDEPATPDYVLAVLRDEHRQACQFDPEVDPQASLSFESTVAEWRAACDLFGWRQLGRAYNEHWGINLSDAEWYAVLEPSRHKRLADVCSLIARHVSRPRIHAAHILGRTCLPAGAFLTIRSLLHQAGASADEIAPSSALAPYTCRYWEVFLGPVSRLAPGTLPLVRISSKPAYDAALVGMLAGALCLLVGACGGLYLLTILGVLLGASCWALSWSTSGSLPASVEFGELRTFRDLAIAVASEVAEGTLVRSHDVHAFGQGF